MSGVAMLTEQVGDVALITSIALLDLEEDGGSALAAALGVRPPGEWPPEHNDAGTREWTRGLYRAHPDEPGYGTWYVIGQGSCGTAGFKGPPAAGSVEVGYSIIAADRLKGFASGAVRLLAARAFRDPRVAVVKAETLPDLVGSQAVLRKCGFALTATGPTRIENGEIWCYQLPRPR